MPAGSSPFVGSSSTSISGSGNSAPLRCPAAASSPANRSRPCHLPVRPGPRSLGPRRCACPASRAARRGCGDCLGRSRSPRTPGSRSTRPPGRRTAPDARSARPEPSPFRRSLDQTQEDADRRRLPRSIRAHEPDTTPSGTSNVRLFTATRSPKRRVNPSAVSALMSAAGRSILRASAARAPRPDWSLRRLAQRHVAQAPAQRERDDHHGSRGLEDGVERGGDGCA